MDDWRIKDNKIICFNTYNKIYPYKASDQLINCEIKRIKKQKKCSELEATEIYKKQLLEQLRRQPKENEQKSKTKKETRKVK